MNLTNKEKIQNYWFGKINQPEIPDVPEGYEDWIIWNQWDVKYRNNPNKTHKLLVVCKNNNIWMPPLPDKDCYKHKEGCAKAIAYCVKKEPVVEHVEHYFNHAGNNYIVEFDVVDGEMDPTTLRNRKL